MDDVHGWNFYDGNNTLYTGADDTHGTHAAGTISAGRGDGGMVGITDNQYVKILVLKALGSDEGKGNTQAVLDAIRYAEANGASICNLSFGSSHSDEAIAQVIRDSKMLFVVAAGNGDDRELGYNIDTTPVYPASLPYDNVLTVANLMFDGNLDESSNYGPKNVDIAAPGVYILSTASDHGYAHMSGTSMAAPHGHRRGGHGLLLPPGPGSHRRQKRPPKQRPQDGQSGGKGVQRWDAGRRGGDGVWERSINLPLSPGNHTISPMHLIKAAVIKRYITLGSCFLYLA